MAKRIRIDKCPLCGAEPTVGRTVHGVRGHRAGGWVVFCGAEDTHYIETTGKMRVIAVRLWHALTRKPFKDPSHVPQPEKPK